MWAAASPTTPRRWLQHRSWSLACRRSIHVDERARLSNEWAPSGGVAASKNEGAWPRCGVALQERKTTTRSQIITSFRCAFQIDTCRVYSPGTATSAVEFRSPLTLLQSHSGIFQLLPLGLRVQDKITRLVDHHMRALGAPNRLSYALQPS